MTKQYFLILVTIILLTMSGCSKDSDSGFYEPEPIEEDPTPENPLPPGELDFEPEETRSFMVNPDATEETVALFYNLKLLSQNSFIVGQQDAFSSFYQDNAGDSDIKKMTGSDPGLLGSDFMFITDDLNDGTPSNWFFQQENQIRDDVLRAFDMGLVNVFCWHFREPFEGEHFYTSEMTQFQRENALKSILPGGENHDYYKQKLEKIASFTKSLVGSNGALVPIIFRPFHEFDGDWFWWGQSFCTIEEYIQLWQFTVTYLKNTLSVNNMLFAFSPDNRFFSESEYLARYPGDDFVDIMGMDNYGDFNNQGQAGVERANQKLKIVSDLAEERVKIASLTETGYFVTLSENGAIPGFFTNNLFEALTHNDVKIGFTMFWYNYQDTYCTPVPGLPSANDFMEFVSKPEVILADDLPEMYRLPPNS
ncbi:glycoside hydrolase family 26 protein [Muricauda sp. MAR_2010_75]|nr:glycosyl hydrolase [Muricauda sp. MAR_2010_75]